MCDDIFNITCCTGDIEKLNNSQWLKLYECFNNIIYYMQCNYRSIYVTRKIGIVNDQDIIFLIDETTPKCIIHNVLKNVETFILDDQKEINYWCGFKPRKNFMLIMICVISIIMIFSVVIFCFFRQKKKCIRNY